MSELITESEIKVLTIIVFALAFSPLLPPYDIELASFNTSDDYTFRIEYNRWQDPMYRTAEYQKIEKLGISAEYNEVI